MNRGAGQLSRQVQPYPKGDALGAKQQAADATNGRWLAIPRTLAFVYNGGDLLLMKRASHKRVFPNQYNGLGGHIERDEDPASAALREIAEESGLRAHSLRLRGLHNIDAGESSGILLFVYTAISDSRELSPQTIEGALEWAPLERVLELDLVEDLPLILPRILAMDDDAPAYSASVSYDENDRIRIRFHDEA